MPVPTCGSRVSRGKHHNCWAAGRASLDDRDDSSAIILVQRHISWTEGYLHRFKRSQDVGEGGGRRGGGEEREGEGEGSGRGRGGEEKGGRGKGERREGEGGRGKGERREGERRGRREREGRSEEEGEEKEVKGVKGRMVWESYTVGRTLLSYKRLLHILTVKMVTFILTIDVCYEDGSPFLAKCNSYWRLHELQSYGE